MKRKGRWIVELIYIEPEDTEDPKMVSFRHQITDQYLLDTRGRETVFLQMVIAQLKRQVDQEAGF